MGLHTSSPSPARAPQKRGDHDGRHWYSPRLLLKMMGFDDPDFIRAKGAKYQTGAPTRFKVGDSVECKIGPAPDDWIPGTVRAQDCISIPLAFSK